MYNTIYPGYVQSYYNINQNKIQKKQENNQESVSSNSGENQKTQTQGRNQNYNSNGAAFFPNGEKVAVDYSKKQIAIEQVLTDFKNMTSAIGTPEEIKSEVTSYLDLIKAQSEKENPNKEVIQGNLKNAAKIIDEYITKTLNKPSKFVEEWVNTLFLQQVDYKTEKKQEEVVEKVEELPQEQAQAEQIEEEGIKEEQQAEVKSNQTEVYIPSDIRLKRMFIQAKKYAAIDNKERALYNFKNTMEYAEEIGDEQTQAMIHFEEGKLYYDFDRAEDALYNYAIAALQTEDNNLKARAYLSMGKIYDDYVNFEPALEHYGAAAAYAGEADNLKIQSKALSDLAQLHTKRYDKKNADMFMKLAAISANSSEDDKVIGVIYSKNAKMQNQLGERARALTSYSTSSQSFAKLEENESLAKNYREAALIMKSYGNKAKAKTLLSKAYSNAQKTDNNELMTMILQDMALL